MYLKVFSSFLGLVFLVLLNVYLLDHFSDLKGINLFLLLAWVNLNVILILFLIFLIVRRIYKEFFGEKVSDLKRKLFVSLLILLATPLLLITTVAIVGKSSYLRVFTDETLKIYLQQIENFERNVNDLNLPPKAGNTLKKDVKALKEETQHLRELVRHQKVILINFFLIFSIISLAVLFGAVVISAKIADLISSRFQEVIEAMKKLSQGNFSVRLKPKEGVETSIKEVVEFANTFNAMAEKLKDAYLRLKREQILFKEVFENVTTGVAIFDKQTGYLLTANRSYKEQFNFDHIDKIRKWFKGKDLYRYEEKNLGNLIMVFVEDLTPFVVKKRYDAWKEIASQLAHDIKNPLHTLVLAFDSISNIVEMLKDAPPDRREFLEQKLFEAVQRNRSQIEERISDITKMIDRFNDFLSKDDELKREKFSLRQFLYRIKRNFETDNFKVYVEVPLVYVNADREKLQRVFENLIRNAKEAIEESGQKVGIVRIKLSGNYLHITDNGPGIPPDKLDKLFLPFTSSKGKGRGLGLFIVKKILEEHGWSIKAIPSKKGEGAHFVIEINPKDIFMS
jgi:two-component system nitrogen regulation sensor histidine kinase NtrY